MTKEEFIDFLKYKRNMKLTKQQERAVNTLEGAIALIAVPGSGKTTTLICRIANLIINHNVVPEKILSLTFSKASANDMKDRFNEKFGDLIEGVVKFNTLHGFSFSVMRSYYGRQFSRFKLLEGFGNDTLNRTKLLKNLYIKYNGEALISEDKLEELGGYISYIKNLMLSKEELKKSEKLFPVPNFLSIFEDYEVLKKENYYLDFDDMLTYCHSIFINNEGFLNRYRETYDYVMLDEAQDTSRIQFEIIKLLAQPKNNLFLVGDDDQSIYSWRGAYPEQLLNFNKVYSYHSTIMLMEQNFRSTKEIVNLSDAFIKNNKTRYKKHIFTENELGTAVRIIPCKSELEQIEYVIKNIADDENFKECAILFRNNLSSIMFVDKFIKEDISFYIKDEVSSFFSHWIIKDLLCFFNLASNQSDLESFASIYYKMKSFIQKKAIYDLKSKEIDKSIFLCLTEKIDNPFIRERLKDFAYKFNILAKLKPDAAVDYIQTQLNYEEYLNEFSSKFNYSMESIHAIISTFRELASETNTFHELLLKLSVLQDRIKASKNNRSNNSITLSTMHSSKGLEFNKVFIIDVNEGVIPTTSSIQNADKGEYRFLEEERRLMYVAMTRARKELHIIYPLKKNDSTILPSRFITSLNMIKSAHLEGVNAKLNKISVGIIILHKSFGKGVVIEVKGDYVTAAFEDGKERMFSEKVCICNNLISIINQ